MGASFTGQRFHEAAMRQLLTGPRGGLNRELQRRARRVEAEAKRLCPVRTGKLRSTIRTVRGTGPEGPYADITAGNTSTPYLGYVMRGTPPHVIRARRAQALSFVWPKAGGRVFFVSVNHPGTQPNDFLSKALRVARG